jgi:hypothetical protein
VKIAWAWWFGYAGLNDTDVRTANSNFLLYAILLFAVVEVGAGEVRLSFIDTAEAKAGTLRVLKEAGISEDGREAFEWAVRDYYAEDLKIAVRGAERTRAGEYRFPSMEALVEGIPKPLCEVNHARGVNCFDTVFMLLGEQARIDLTLNSLRGPFFGIVVESDSLSIRPTANPADAFLLTNPEWYRDLSAKYFPKRELFERRVCLTAAMFTSYPLPIPTETNRLSEVALDVLKARWRGFGLKVEGGLKIVLGHEVNFPGRYFVTGHAGLLVRNSDGWMYLEKAGGAGPFVRMDIDDPAELRAWFKGLYPKPKNGYTHFLFSLNDEKMFEVEGSLGK